MAAAPLSSVISPVKRQVHKRSILQAQPSHTSRQRGLGRACATAWSACCHFRLLSCDLSLAPVQVQLDYDELPAGAAASLRDSLVGLLLRFAHGSRPTRTQLCLALAALAAHLPAAEWGSGGCVQWLANRMSGEPGEAALPCMLELLTVLPQVLFTRWPRC